MKRMRVGVDARMILNKKIGTGVYAYGLWETIRQLAPADVEVVLFDDGYSKSIGYRSFVAIQNRGLRKVAYTLWLNSYFPMLLKKEKIDIVHAPNIIPPFTKVCKTVITVHDLGPFVCPQFYDPRYWRHMRRLYPIACSVADAVIVPSHYVRRELHEILGVAENKIFVTYEAQREYFRPILCRRMLAQARRKYGLPTRFFLAVGQVTARKNLSMLVKAFARVCSLLETSNLYLVVVGRDDDGEQARLSALATRLKVVSQVIFTGYVEDRVLPYYYNLATIFVYPSLYEGFGIPPLEAMACGTPVVVSDHGSLPEIVGDSGIVVKGDSEDDLADALVRISSQQTLGSELRKRGLNRAGRFSMTRFAQQTLAVYRSLASEFPR